MTRSTPKVSGRIMTLAQRQTPTCRNHSNEATKFAGNSSSQGSHTEESSRRALETERAVENCNCACTT